jgi:methionine sulfoxide reductase heme-binding subunit
MSTQPAIQPSSRLGRPLGTGRDCRRRLLLHHVPLALTSAALLVLFMAFPPFTNGGFALLDMGTSSPFPTTAAYGMQGGGSRTFESAFTLATGYVATVLLGLTLLIGPANLLLRRRTPVSTSLARDTGTWAVIASIVHVIVGLKVHGDAGDLFNFVNYFFSADGSPRTNSFGLGNWVGLVALVIVVGLLALSNDRSLRELKARRWKNLQRMNYALFALVVLHALLYGALLRMTSPFTLVLIFTVLAVFIGQAVGIWLWRRKHVRTGDALAQQAGERERPAAP